MLTTFIKTQVALIIGSVVDFLVTILLVEVFHCWYVTGTSAGNVSGAILQFVLSRNWAFKATQQKLTGQVMRFILMWSGNIAIASYAIYQLTNNYGIHYLLSKLVVSSLLGISYTYLFSKWFVFS